MHDAELMDQFHADAEAETKAAAGPSTTLIELGQELVSLKDEIAEHEAALKLLKERYEALRKHDIPDEMQRLGLKTTDGKGSVLLADGTRLTLTTTLYADVKAADREKFYAWMKQNGHSSLVKESVNTNTLRAFCKELMEDEKPLPPMVSTYFETAVTVTRSKK